MFALGVAGVALTGIAAWTLLMSMDTMESDDE